MGPMWWGGGMMFWRGPGFRRWGMWGPFWGGFGCGVRWFLLLFLVILPIFLIVEAASNIRFFGFHSSYIYIIAGVLLFVFLVGCCCMGSDNEDEKQPAAGQ